MAKKRGNINMLEQNSWLYEIDFRRDEFTSDLLNHNKNELKNLLRIANDDKDGEQIHHFDDLLSDLEQLYSDFDLQIGTFIEAEENGEDYIIEQYDQSIDDVEEEIIYVLDQIFDIFDARLDSKDGHKFKFCWAGIN